MSFSIGVRGGCGRVMSSVKNAGSSCSQPYQCALDLKTTFLTGESGPLHAARMFIVPMTLFSWATRGGATLESTVRRVSITVSISAAATIRRMSACCVPTRTNSVRSSARVGSLESTPMTVSTPGSCSRRCARRPPQNVDRPVRRMRRDFMRAESYPNQTLVRLASMSYRFSWTSARTSWATVWTSAVSRHGSSPHWSVGIGSRKRMRNFAGK